MAYKKYKLTDSQVVQIARLCVQEQGSTVGARAEASLMANQLETSPSRQKKYGTDGNGLYNWVRNGGWFYKAAYYMDNGSASESQISAVRDALCNGNRTLPQYVDEHDCISDIKSVTNNGKSVDKKNRSNYIQNVSIVKNNMGSTWTFWSFPASGSDPFGYTKEAYDYVMKGETSSVDRLIKTAEAEVGYLEKASNKDLDSKTANAGNKNYTKYARDLMPSVQGMFWCDTFVNWCFYKAFGKDTAKKMLGVISADCDETVAAFKSAGRWFKQPQRGDVVAFVQDGNDYYHVGIVYAVDSTTVYTIEGNTSAGTQVIPNGGSVCKKSYPLGYSKIGGYGRPNYVIAEGSSADTGKSEDEEMRITVTANLPELSKGDTGLAVRIWQAIVGTDVDGEFGSATRNATIRWQAKKNLAQDGIVGTKSWTTALKKVN